MLCERRTFRVSSVSKQGDRRDDRLDARRLEVAAGTPVKKGVGLLE
jgi:hypothetical protein